MWESETCRPFTTREIAFAEKVAAAEREVCANECIKVLEESNSIAASVCAGRIKMRSNASLSGGRRPSA